MFQNAALSTPFLSREGSVNKMSSHHIEMQAPSRETSLLGALHAVRCYPKIERWGSREFQGRAGHFGRGGVGRELQSTYSCTGFHCPGF